VQLSWHPEPVAPRRVSHTRSSHGAGQRGSGRGDRQGNSCRLDAHPV